MMRMPTVAPVLKWVGPELQVLLKLCPFQLQEFFFIGQVSMGTHTLSGTLEIAYYSRDETTYKMSFPGLARRFLKV